MTPDGWIRYYYERRDAGAPAINIVDSEGRVYRAKCSKCRGTVRHATREGGYACGHCGAAWPYDDVFLLKGQITKAARRRGDRIISVPQRAADESERRLANMVQVGTMLHRLLNNRNTAIPARLYVLNAMGMSVADIARTAPERLGISPISETTLKGIIRVTRQGWADALDRVGLLR